MSKINKQITCLTTVAIFSFSVCNTAPNIYRREESLTSSPIKHSGFSQESYFSPTWYSVKEQAPKKNYRIKYKKIKESKWFNDSYVGKSAGESIRIE